MSVRAALIMVLTFVFGIVPATALVFFALMLASAGVSVVFSGNDAGLALLGVVSVAAAVLSLYGYAALFHAAGDAVTPKVARWLGAGIVANVIGIGVLVKEREWFDLGFWLFLCAPLVVGCAHLIRFAVKRLPARSRR
jgi:hypothetical protein